MEEDFVNYVNTVINDIKLVVKKTPSNLEKYQFKELTKVGEQFVKKILKQRRLGRNPKKIPFLYFYHVQTDAKENEHILKRTLKSLKVTWRPALQLQFGGFLTEELNATIDEYLKSCIQALTNEEKVSLFLFHKII